MDQARGAVATRATAANLEKLAEAVETPLNATPLLFCSFLPAPVFSNGFLWRQVRTQAAEHIVLMRHLHPTNPALFSARVKETHAPPTQPLLRPVIR